jgi:hypothetical protein
MGATDDKPECGACGATERIWRTCVGPRCDACPCEAPKHGQHVMDYAWNGMRCFVRAGEVVYEKIPEQG